MATDEIEISELEQTEDLNSDNLIPVESLTDTRATSLGSLRNWLKNFFSTLFVGKTGDEEIRGQKKFIAEEGMQGIKHYLRAEGYAGAYNNYYANGDVLSDYMYCGYDFCDKNDKMLARWVFAYGNMRRELWGQVIDPSTGANTTITKQGFDNNGKKYLEAPRCRSENLASTTSRDVATIADVNERLGSISMNAPNGSYVSLSLPTAKGQVYTASITGWLYIEGRLTGNNGWVNLAASDLGVNEVVSHAYEQTTHASILIPIKKGMKFTLGYSSGMTVVIVRILNMST